MLGIIKKLTADEKLAEFRLIGGTALALQLGHRKSIDIDLFSEKPFNVFQMFEHLHTHYSYVQRNFSEQGTKGYIGLIQCDIFNHNNKWIDEPEIIEGVRMASIKEIAAMKIYAIIQSNGTRLKDFADVAFLTGKLSLQQILQAFQEKYSGISDTLALKSLFYFDNINFDAPVHYLTGKVTWTQLKSRFDMMQQHPDKIFEPL